MYENSQIFTQYRSYLLILKNEVGDPSKNEYCNNR